MLTARPVIFFEMAGIVILNILCNLAIVHCFMRNALLSGVECAAKSREEAMKMKEKEKNEFFETLREKNKKIEEKRRAKEERERRKIKEKEEERKRQREKDEERRKLRTEEREKEKEKIQKETKKEEKKTKDEKDLKEEMGTKEIVAPPAPEESKEKKPEAKKEEEKSDIEKENEELRKKIKEQKKILRKKLETIRRNAFITRKPEEIEKAEKLIKDILTKHNLTEDMLKDDDE
jgi:hypothetical protein